MTRPHFQSMTLAERLDYFTVPEALTGCFLWVGPALRDGRGRLSHMNRDLMATHVALDLAGRPLRPGENALHKCDTPACVNPDHLYAGTQKENARDMVVRKRVYLMDHAALCKSGKHPMPENLRVRADGTRDCKGCRTEYARKHRRSPTRESWKALQNRARAHAAEYAAQALSGLLEMSQFDPVMMPWPKNEHDAVLKMLRRLRDRVRHMRVSKRARAALSATEDPNG